MATLLSTIFRHAQGMLHTLSTTFCYKLKPANSMYHYRPQCLRGYVLTILRNSCLQFNRIYYLSAKSNIYKITLQLEARRLRYSRRTGYWKMVADKSNISKISLEQLHHWLNMRRSDVLHESHSLRTFTQLKCWNDLVVQNFLITVYH